MLRAAALWAAFAAALNLGWELLQLPLYTIYSEGDLAAIAYAVAHCTIGDVLIAAACYGVAALATREPRWPVRRPAAGLVAAIAAGMVYTAFSEWLNVSVRGAWAYAEAMPTVFGIGIAPLAQWLIVPAATLLLARLTLQRWESSNSAP